LLRLILCFISLSFAADLPFWKAKAKVYERIENGEVIVSVSAKKNEFKEPPPHLLKARGGGIVGAPCAFTFEHAQNYEEIAKLSGFITGTSYDAATQTMDLTISAFLYSTSMKIQIQPKPDPKPRHIEFDLLSGPMKGFHYVMTFTEIGSKKCEVGMDGTYRYLAFPLPTLFMEFGMESMLQITAKRLRSHVEERWTSPARS
jgi:hypothetical protein